MRKGMVLSFGLLASGCYVGPNDDIQPPVASIDTLRLEFTGGVSSTETVMVGDLASAPADAPILGPPITLSSNLRYTLNITFIDTREDPPLDLNGDIREASDQYQTFLLGDAVNGPASIRPGAPLVHTYEDDNLGLVNAVVTLPGQGTLQVLLQYIPLIGGETQKTEGLARELALNRELPGEPDVWVEFPVSIE